LRLALNIGCPACGRKLLTTASKPIRVTPGASKWKNPAEPKKIAVLLSCRGGRIRFSHRRFENQKL
jgi:hypothetical protein